MDQKMHQDLPSLERLLGGQFPWVFIALIAVAVFAINTVKIGRITGEQVGVLLNKITGKTSTMIQPGMKFYNGLTHQFFILDKTLQTLEMTADQKRGDLPGKDDLKIKTIDGSDVYVDLKVQYRIDPEAADVVIKTSGVGDHYKKKWTRDYIRTLAREHLGELTTEEFYDAAKRALKVDQIQVEANEILNGFGIIIDSIVIPKKPHFYQEYEDMIKKKKLADQVVLEEQSKAHAAKQRQQTMIVEETNIKNVEIEKFRGEMEQKLIATQAAGEKAKREADAYYDKATIGAEAYLYKMQKNAEAVLVEKQSVAKGIEALKLALEGEGGRNMVKMEYAKKLKNIFISGKPFTVEAHTKRFEHLSQEAAASGNKK